MSDYGVLGTNYTEVASHESNAINYGAGMSFIEDGVHSVGVTYMDGVLKSRQSQAKLNSQDKIIVGSTIYDHYGRPAIGVMSAPVSQSTLGYVDNLNMHTDGTAYGKEHFDLDAETVCGEFVVAPPMSSTLSAGSAHYYSDDNPDKEGANAYLPDAEGYPFVQVHYADDPTGRVKRAGGVGPDHQIGSTTIDGSDHAAHYTEYFYTTPDDDEVYELFGNNGLSHENYTKIITKDVHGQLSVAIIDPMGRTIATYMAGAAPTGLEAIEGNDGLSPAVKDFMSYNTVDELEGILSVNHPIFVEDKTVIYAFDYDFTAANFTDCLPPDLCFDCIYDVKISIVPDEVNSNCRIQDGAGNNIDDPVTGEVHMTYTVGSLEAFDPSNCVTPLTFSGVNGTDAANFNVKFPAIGSYQIIKTLTVSQTPIDYYWSLYQDNSTCLLTEEFFLEEALSHIDPSDCEDLSPCEFNFLLEHGTLDMYLAANPGETEADYLTKKSDYLTNCGSLNPCDILLPMMMADFSSGGQYCVGDLYASLPNAESSALLAALNVGDWRDHGPFYEADGVTESVMIDYLGVSHSAPYTSISAYEFGLNWKDSWAENFVHLHPEYCYYSFCGANEDLFEYEHLMNSQTTAEGACLSGVLNPFSGTPIMTSVDGTSCTALTDPIFDGLNLAAPTSALEIAIAGIINTGYEIGESTLNIYELAVHMSGDNHMSVDFGTGCHKDQHWLNFRALYFSKRFQIIDLLTAEYVSSGSCSIYATCIGTTDAPCGGSPFETKIKRYFDYTSAFFDLSNLDILDFETEGEAVELAIEASCLSQCEGLANAWMSQLSGCVPLDGTVWAEGNTTYDLVKAKLIEVCAGGCGAEWPFPTQIDSETTTNTTDVNPVNWTFNSFEDVITTFCGAATVSCSHLLITNPLASNGTESLANYLNECSCTALLESSTAEEFEALYGFIPLNYDGERCECEGFVTAGTLDVGALDAVAIPTPNIYPCESICVSCLSLQHPSLPSVGFIPEFESAYGVPYSDEPALFTNYVNSQTNGAYTYENLSNLIENCATLIAPYGTPIYNLIDPSADAIKDLLNALAEDDITTNHLDYTYLTLSAYFNSELYTCGDEATATYDYTPTLTGSTLSFNLAGTDCAGSCTLNLSLESSLPAGFTDIAEVFENIISFGELYVVTAAVPLDINEFYMTTTVANPSGGTETLTFKLTSASCHIFMQSIYDEKLRKHTFEICSGAFEPVEGNPCLDDLIETAENMAESNYNDYLDLQYELFKQNYISTCSNVPDETFKADYFNNHYHYTLLHYDQSGNLVKTVPPKGIDFLTPS